MVSTPSSGWSDASSAGLNERVHALHPFAPKLRDQIHQDDPVVDHDAHQDHKPNAAIVSIGVDKNKPHALPAMAIGP